METTIKINTDQLNMEIIDAIKKMFPSTVVEISIQPADDTEYILSNPAFKDELLARIKKYGTQKLTVEVPASELSNQN